MVRTIRAFFAQEDVKVFVFTSVDMGHPVVTGQLVGLTVLDSKLQKLLLLRSYSRCGELNQDATVVIALSLVMPTSSSSLTAATRVRGSSRLTS